MSLFLGLMLVQKMIVAVLPLSLSHVCFKIGNEDIGIPSSSPTAAFAWGVLCCILTSGLRACSPLCLCQSKRLKSHWFYSAQTLLLQASLREEPMIWALLIWRQIITSTQITAEDQANICCSPVLLPGGHSWLVLPVPTQSGPTAMAEPGTLV